MKAGRIDASHFGSHFFRKTLKKGVNIYMQTDILRKK